MWKSLWNLFGKGDGDLFCADIEVGDDRVFWHYIVRARGENKRDLHFASDAGLYALDADAKLTRVDDAGKLEWLQKNAAISDREGVLEVDAASVLYIDDKDKRCRLPKKGDPIFDGQADSRLCREVATERDLFNCHGTFYELPAENATGFARVCPIATHNHCCGD